MRTLLAFLMVALSSASFAYDYHIRNVKVLKVEPFVNGDYFVRITLDLNGVIDPNDYESFLGGCAPTKEAWVVTAWGYTGEFESQIMSTASLAMVNGNTVDVLLHDTVCDTNANMKNLPLDDISDVPASGLGRRVYGLVINSL